MPSGIWIHPDVWPQQTWAENWGLCGACALLGELGPHLTQCGRDRGLPHAKFHLDPQYTNVTDWTGHKDRTGQTTVR